MKILTLQLSSTESAALDRRVAGLAAMHDARLSPGDLLERPMGGILLRADRIPAAAIPLVRSHGFKEVTA
jgi:hypothetical protein